LLVRQAKRPNALPDLVPKVPISSLCQRKNAHISSSDGVFPQVGTVRGKQRSAELASAGNNGGLTDQAESLASILNGPDGVGLSVMTATSGMPINVSWLADLAHSIEGDRRLLAQVPGIFETTEGTRSQG
jgi:hypothetical protein